MGPLEGQLKYPPGDLVAGRFGRKAECNGTPAKTRGKHPPVNKLRAFRRATPLITNHTGVNVRARRHNAMYIMHLALRSI
jgi:hypothetical protein